MLPAPRRGCVLSAARVGPPALGRLARRRLRNNALARSLRRAALSGLDGIEGALCRRDPLQPPRRLRGVGAGDFRDVGVAIVDQLVEAGGLLPGDRVLDMGCGSGRVAIPLTGHLVDGAYAGFDVEAEVIDWCRSTISAQFPAFSFDVLDIANTHYNPAGALPASAVRFPYDDDVFDFVAATSLFTHMLPAAVANYLREAARVLAPGGTLFATFFLVDDDVRERLGRGEDRVGLRHELRDEDGTGVRVMDRRTPETAVGLESEWVSRVLADAGLERLEVWPGTWCGRPEGLSFQDVVVAHLAHA